MSDPNESELDPAQTAPDRPGPPSGGGGRGGGGRGDGRRGPGDDREGWSDRVTVVPGPDGFAYVPGEVLTTDPDRTIEAARRVFPRLGLRVVDPEDDQELRATPARRVQGVPDVPRLVRELRAAGAPVQPNHVFFAHDAGSCCGCGPHPAARGCGGGTSASPVYASPVYASPVYASPVYASPVYASPVYASPVYASPVYASPVYASPVYASPAEAETGLRRSSARPVSDHRAVKAATDKLAVAAATTTSGDKSPHVVVLDTGLPADDGTHFPPALDGMAMLTHAAGPRDLPDQNGDDLLDPAAGHGSFIAGVIEQVAPGAVVESRAVIGPLGDATESAIAAAIGALADPGALGAVLNLSFGGQVMTEPGVLASAISAAQDRGYVVVASAGNDGTCRPTYPAAFPDVVGVGAIGPNGPAPFTNYGSWVRACAPGVDLVSTLFAFEGAEAPVGTGTDPDDFDGWAVWSGSSFSAPIVAAALVNHMRTHGVSARDAVKRVIDDPALLRLADLGTVINLA